MANDLDKGDFAHDCKVVMEFLRVMLRLWAQELQARDGDVKASVKGKETSFITNTYYSIDKRITFARSLQKLKITTSFHANFTTYDESSSLPAFRHILRSRQKRREIVTVVICSHEMLVCTSQQHMLRRT